MWPKHVAIYSESRRDVDSGIRCDPQVLSLCLHAIGRKAADPDDLATFCQAQLAARTPAAAAAAAARERG
jgi:hypothetical protein